MMAKGRTIGQASGMPGQNVQEDLSDRRSVHFSLPDLCMKREYPETPLVGVGAIIIEGARVVLVKRGHAPLLGKWSIPGGVLEIGETLRSAVVREALEETGLTIEPGELLGVFERVVPDAQGRMRYHYVLIDFLCRRVAGQLAAADDADEALWFSREELSALKLARETEEVILKGFEKVSGPS
jgi:8-oxo-dGTP diphosphatase